MCGISGIIASDSKLPEQAVSIVRKMNDALTHRGPDEAGYYDDKVCALAMRRLAIIDLGGGQQPIYNETGDILIFLNGEIYNYQILREELNSKGHTFRTDSDTEVLVHLYEEYGLAMFGHINGMYAICLFDRQKNVHILARDRFGEKPLYYAQTDKGFVFSSEINSLILSGYIDKELDQEALSYYLRTSLVPEPLTLFSHVKTLPAGSYLKIEQCQIEIKKYFHIEYKPDPKIRTLEDAVGLIKPLLLQAVKNQSISDVPVGSFLSGGIDSSTMVALLQKQSSKPIQTFNVRFEDNAYDESPIARAVAQHCGTDHHEVVVPNEEFTEDIFWQIIEHMGQPFRDSSAIPTHHVCKAIGSHVKVAISGDGGDELFGGYDLFQWYTRILALKKIPSSLRSLAAAMTRMAQKTPGLSQLSKLRQASRALQTARLSDADIAIALNEMFTVLEMNTLLEEGFQESRESFELLKNYPQTSQNWPDLRRVMYYRTQHTLTANMLVKVDRMSMANSLEVRAPFLDKDLSEAAATLPDEFLISNGQGKYLLRKIMKDELPAEVFDHSKQGFNIPLHKYQNDTFRRLAKRLLFDENPLPGLFRKVELEKIYHQGLSMKQDTSTLSVFRASHQLWMIMQFLGWAERFGVTLNARLK